MTSALGIIVPRVEKRCGRCSQVKPVTEFHRWRRGDGYQPWCKACRKAYDAAYTARTLERRRRQRASRKPEFMAWYRSLKEDRPCTDCGGRFVAEAMQWDHLPGTHKAIHVGDLVSRMSRSAVLAEIAKCELVCANCHALRTVRRRESGV